MQDQELTFDAMAPPTQVELKHVRKVLGDLKNYYHLKIRE